MDYKRELKIDGGFCEHCGDLEGPCIIYDNGVSWCPACVFANGSIKEKQLNADYAEIDAAKKLGSVGIFKQKVIDFLNDKADHFEIQARTKSPKKVTHDEVWAERLRIFAKNIEEMEV